MCLEQALLTVEVAADTYAKQMTGDAGQGIWKTCMRVLALLAAHLFQSLLEAVSFFFVWRLRQGVKYLTATE